MRLLAAEMIKQALPMAQAIEALRQAFRLAHEGQAVVPLRSSLPIAPFGGTMLTMPAFLAGLGERGALGEKIVNIFPHNPERNLPLIQALYILHQADTGQLLALLEGATLTAIRTGAASGLAADYLARREARTLGLIGTGAQAYCQVEALRCLRPIRRVLLYNRTPAKAEALALRLQRAWGLSASVLDDPDEVAAQAEVLITATSSKNPVFSGEAVRAGATVIAIGAFTPEARECDDVLIARARLYVDAREAALAEAGELLIPIQQGLISESDIVAELSELVTGAAPGRQNEREIIMFKSVGLALEDLAAAYLAYRNAVTQKLGREVDW
ncbi:MAG TPA: ornithine cyclodeaminase family protein [Candidatus Fraserbacteria bacterium]|nr:ornithine cyclodeaminase family protein [Candidatus Fraserbacteria bacterium]